MHNSPEAGKPAEAQIPSRVPGVAGVVTVLYGLLILVAWHAHWRPVLQLLPGSAPMQYNTALGFILSGAGLFLLATRRPGFAPWLAGVTAIFALLTLLEYPMGRDFGIDQFFFKPYFEAETAFHGRMSPLSAVCFIFLGVGIAAAGGSQTRRPRLAVAGLLGCVVTVVGVIALLGYALGIGAAYGWGSYSRMAVNTAALFVLAGTGLLVWSLTRARTENFDFVRWLPVSASVALLTMIAFVSATNSLELGKATFWRKHTFDVILKTQAFEENVLDLQRGTRGYITTGDTNFRAAFQASAQLEPMQFKRLVELTADNPAQQELLKKLAAAMNEVFSYDKRMIAICDQAGFKAATDADPNGQSRVVFGNARDILRLFSREEKRLLETRDLSEQTDSTNEEHLLLFGIVMAGGLVLFANYLASRELTERRRVEREREKIITQLQEALTDVKTLSGMIPICAWCKNIRSDQGFWQSVEDYVRTRTDATFSHGVCPNCAKKVRADIARFNPK